MTGQPPIKPVLSHVSLGVTDVSRAAVFYDAVMRTLGVGRLMEHGRSIAWGKSFPCLWIGLPHDGRRASPGNGVHVCFNADTARQVMDFHAAGLAAGGFDDGAPGYRPEYAPCYYAAFLRDPDGNKIEAVAWVEQD